VSTVPWAQYTWPPRGWAAAFLFQTRRSRTVPAATYGGTRTISVVAKRKVQDGKVDEFAEAAKEMVAAVAR
jgi:hypothetical protein